MYKLDLALNNPQGLIYHKKHNQPTEDDRWGVCLLIFSLPQCYKYLVKMCREIIQWLVIFKGKFNVIILGFKETLAYLVL